MLPYPGDHAESIVGMPEPAQSAEIRGYNINLRLAGTLAVKSKQMLAHCRRRQEDTGVIAYISVYYAGEQVTCMYPQFDVAISSHFRQLRVAGNGCCFHAALVRNT